MSAVAIEGHALLRRRLAGDEPSRIIHPATSHLGAKRKLTEKTLPDVFRRARNLQ